MQENVKLIFFFGGGRGTGQRHKRGAKRGGLPVGQDAVSWKKETRVRVSEGVHRRASPNPQL